MEYGLGRDYSQSHERHQLRLNPCFNGIWSRTLKTSGSLIMKIRIVLILVLMEYGLGLVFRVYI